MTTQPGTPKSDSDRLVRIETLLEQVVSRDTDTEIRLRRVERWMYIAVGMAAASGVGSLAALAGSFPTTA